MTTTIPVHEALVHDLPPENVGAMVAELLSNLFIDARGLHRFIAQRVSKNAADSMIISSLSETADSAASALIRHGMIDGDFFRCLKDSFPKRQSAIEHAEALISGKRPEDGVASFLATSALIDPEVKRQIALLEPVGPSAGLHSRKPHVRHSDLDELKSLLERARKRHHAMFIIQIVYASVTGLLVFALLGYAAIVAMAAPGLSVLFGVGGVGTLLWAGKWGPFHKLSEVLALIQNGDVAMFEVGLAVRVSREIKDPRKRLVAIGASVDRFTARIFRSADARTELPAKTPRSR